MNLTAAQRQRITDSSGFVLVGLLAIWLLANMSKDPALFINQTTTGISNGAVIALIALGYTMVYGIIELINFAHADVFMIGSMVGMQIIVMSGVGPGSGFIAKFGIVMIALVVCMVLCAGINVGIERVAYRPLRDAPPLAPLITAIGVSFILSNIAQKVWGPSQVNVPDLLGSHEVIAGLRGKDIFLIGVTVPLLWGLSHFVKNTKHGKAMRATAQDKAAAAIMGIDVDKTIALTFILGGLLAGASGVLYALVNTTVVWNAGFKNGLFAFTAAVLGGIGNLTGAVLGGLMIGLIASYSVAFIGDRWTDIVIFSILVLVLIFRPTGLLGEKSVARA
jgi:branched-chain amino acid transport system permease protein